MTRRVSLPGADELFRSTGPRDQAQESENRRIASEPVEPEPPGHTRAGRGPAYAGEPGVSTMPQGQDRTMPAAPRPKHGQKVTFYCTDEELTRLERARLALRAEHRLACDRGRLVRAALDEVLDEFETAGERSALVRRLRRP